MGAPLDHRAACGEAVCAECAALDDFAQQRTARCPHMATKTSCNRCATHCYPAKMQARIREVMRYAGPRMLFHHPIAALRHLIGK